MSRYVDLQDAWIRARLARLAHRDSVFAFVERFVIGFAAFLEAPPSAVRLVSCGDSSGVRPCTASAASSLEADGSWRAELGIALAGSDADHPTLELLVQLRIARDSDALIVALSERGPALRVDPDPRADLSAAFSALNEELIKWLRTSGGAA